MPEWIDLALTLNEDDLAREIDQLSPNDRKRVLDQLLTVFRLKSDTGERAILRLMVERARPMALPSALWRRPISSSSDILAEADRHFKRLRVDSTHERLQKAQDLYAQFVAERGNERVTEQQLKAQGYRCWHCGLAFCDEELRLKGFVSPFGSRRKDKNDPLKLHWVRVENRLPTLDHCWPIKLYGDNQSRNHRVLCFSCNEGKAHYMATEQMPPFVGLPRRAQFLGNAPLPEDVFYAQIRLNPECFRTGKTARDTELTVEFRDPQMLGVLDNLVTVESPGL
jgi:hypothetical protein